MRWLGLICIVAVAGCGQAPQDEAAAPGPTAPPLLADMSPRDALLDCAGAIAAEAGLDLLADPSLGTPEEDAYFTVLALMDKEPGLEGAAGREATTVSRDAWLQYSAEQREARAGECITRFVGQADAAD